MIHILYIQCAVLYETHNSQSLVSYSRAGMYIQSHSSTMRCNEILHLWACGMFEKDIWQKNK